MKLLSLLSLCLLTVCGCSDTSTNTALDDRTDAQPYEVNKPIVDDTAVTTHDPAMVEPMEPSTTPPPEPTGNTDVNADLENNSDVNGAAVPSPQGPVDTEIKDPVTSNDLAPADQSDQAEADLVEGIRTQIDDANLSDAAEKIEIATNDGNITLSGKVKNQAEKDRIEDIAIRLAGEENVTNELEIE